jgi:hypothetical protein
VAILLALCDLVEASHGQFYGSWDRLIERYPWSRSWWFKWLPHLEQMGLIEKLGRLPGRGPRTTWQVLPHLYRDKSTTVDTGDPLGSTAQSTGVDSDTPQPETPLVSTKSALLASIGVDTNIGTSLNNEEKIALTGAASPRKRDFPKPSEVLKAIPPLEDLEAEKERQKRRLAQLAEARDAS